MENGSNYYCSGSKISMEVKEKKIIYFVYNVLIMIAPKVYYSIGMHLITEYLSVVCTLL